MAVWRDVPGRMSPMVFFKIKVEASIHTVGQSMSAADDPFRAQAQSTNEYKIMGLVGQFTGSNEWSPACAKACYRAARNLNGLSLEEHAIIDGFYSRITSTKSTKIKCKLSLRPGQISESIEINNSIACYRAAMVGR